MTMEDLVQRVATGADELDSQNPGWFEKVNTDHLNTENPDTCILGQVYGDYFIALELLGWSFSDGFRLGFDLRSAEESHDAYTALKNLWTAEISARKAAKDQLVP